MNSLDIDIGASLFLLRFPYSAEMVVRAHGIPGSRWDKPLKAWKCPVSLSNYKIIRACFSPIEDSEAVIKWASANAPIEEFTQLTKSQLNKLAIPPKDYTFKTKPFRHQIITFNHFKNKDVAGIFLDMGLGKSKVVIDIAAYKYKKKLIKKILYVCPNSVTENVADEFKLHSTVDFKVLVLADHKDKKIKLLALKDADVYVVNFESLYGLASALFEFQFDMIIVDESSRIKNPSADCSKVMHALAEHVPYRAALTGTPVTEGAEDIFSQFKFLDSSVFGESYMAFKSQYMIMGGYNGKVCAGYRNIEELKNKIFSRSLRFTKAQCLDLPPKIYETRRFDLNKDEIKLYNKVRDNIMVEFKRKEVSTSIILTKIVKLSQVTSGFIKSDDEKIIPIKNPSRVRVLEEIISELKAKKIIVWCKFRYNIVQVEELCAKLKLGYVSFHGGIEKEDRLPLVKKFNNDPACSIFISQIKTGGIGLNLTSAQYAIYYTNDYSLEARLQSEDRSHRIGQKNQVTYIDLVARGTLDEAIVMALKDKKDFADKVMGSDMLEETLDGKI